MERKKSKNKTFNTFKQLWGRWFERRWLFTKVINLQCSWIKRLYDENFREWKIIPSYLIKIIFCKNFKFHPCLDSSIRSPKTVPNFYKEMITNGKNTCSVLLPYHQRFFPSFYGLTRILKLTIRAILSLTLRVKTSTLSVRFFTKISRLNHGIILNQKTTVKTSWNIVGFSW